MFELFMFTLTNFLAKIIFPEGIGGVQKSRNSGGVREEGGGSVILAIKIWKFLGSRRGLCKIPSVGGCAYFLEITHFRYPAQ